MASSNVRGDAGVHSTLVIHQGALGDFILSLPALKSLRMGFPRAKSMILGYPRILELVQNRFYAEEIFSIDQKGMATFFVQGGSVDSGLSQFFMGFDLIVVFGKDGGGTLVDNLRRVCQGQILPIHSFPPRDEKVHLTDYLLRQFAQQGLAISERTPTLHLKDSDRKWAKDFWRSQGVTSEERAKMIVLHPGSGSKKKVWPLDRFLAIAQKLRDHFDSKIFVVVGPAEGTEVQKTFEEIGLQGLILGGGLTLLQLASAMEGCWFYVGNDSGISHLATALKLPTVVIFGPSDERIWAPRGEETAIIRRDIPCSPCPPERLSQCKDFECLNGIEVDEVLGGLEKIGIKINC